MSGRQVNGWGECVWCGEMLKPEDKNRYSDLCEHCEKWNELAQLLIKRRSIAEKKVSKAIEEKNVKAALYWQRRKNVYSEMLDKIREALNLKKHYLWGECY